MKKQLVLSIIMILSITILPGSALDIVFLQSEQDDTPDALYSWEPGDSWSYKRWSDINGEIDPFGFSNFTIVNTTTYNGVEAVMINETMPETGNGIQYNYYSTDTFQFLGKYYNTSFHSIILENGTKKLINTFQSHIQQKGLVFPYQEGTYTFNITGNYTIHQTHILDDENETREEADGIGSFIWTKQWIITEEKIDTEVGTFDCWKIEETITSAKVSIMWNGSDTNTTHIPKYTDTNIGFKKFRDEFGPWFRVFFNPLTAWISKEYKIPVKSVGQFVGEITENYELVKLSVLKGDTIPGFQIELFLLVLVGVVIGKRKKKNVAYIP